MCKEQIKPKTIKRIYPFNDLIYEILGVDALSKLKNLLQNEHINQHVEMKDQYCFGWFFLSLGTWIIKCLIILSYQITCSHKNCIVSAHLITDVCSDFDGQSVFCLWWERVSDDAFCPIAIGLCPWTAQSINLKRKAKNLCVFLWFSAPDIIIIRLLTSVCHKSSYFSSIFPNRKYTAPKRFFFAYDMFRKLVGT